MPPPAEPNAWPTGGALRLPGSLSLAGRIEGLVASGWMDNTWERHGGSYLGQGLAGVPSARRHRSARPRPCGHVGAVGWAAGADRDRRSDGALGLPLLRGRLRPAGLCQGRAGHRGPSPGPWRRTPRSAGTARPAAAAQSRWSTRLVRVEGTPRSHARGSSTGFDDISAARGGRVDDAETSVSRPASNLPATKPHVATDCTVSLRHHQRADQP
jgi:hypothetical protein